MAPRIELVRTNGIFSLDGEDFEVENNIWLLGDDDEVLVVDAAHDAAPIVDAIDGRNVLGIFLTHGHNDHINAAGALREAVDAPDVAAPGRSHALGRRVSRTTRPTPRSSTATSSRSPVPSCASCTRRGTVPVGCAC